MPGFLVLFLVPLATAALLGAATHNKCLCPSFSSEMWAGRGAGHGTAACRGLARTGQLTADRGTVCCLGFVWPR